MRDLAPALATFLACAVEMVEALTIVLALGVTRGWRSVRHGVLTALLALAVAVALLGPTLTLLPLDVLRLVVGFLLLVFGLQWMRKAILRAAGIVSLHDEASIYERVAQDSRATTTASTRDWYAFTLSFKGVFLEGLEVVFIVLTVGAAHHDVATTAGAAVAALVVVTGVGIAVHRPLTRVPENTMKFSVGIMLTSFGTFWGAEGAGATWPGSDGALLVLVALYTLVGVVLVAALRRRDPSVVRS
jgi:uncharacterized membrane protein